jgi:hypothetical protein
MSVIFVTSFLRRPNYVLLAGVEHFRRSAIDRQDFNECQERFGLPKHQLAQRVSTRWNSMYKMIDRFLEQKLAVGDFANRHGNFDNLTKAEWEMLEEARNLLQPFLTATLKFSKADCSISEVIPTIKWLRCKTEAIAVTALDPVKQEMLTYLNMCEPQYFGGLEDQQVYSFATVLDPRYKTAFFSGSDVTKEVVSSLKSVVTALKQARASSASEEIEPPTKRCKSNIADICLDEVANNSLCGDTNQGKNFLIILPVT